MHIVHVSELACCVSLCVVTDGPFNNLDSMVARGTGMPKMSGVTLFFMTTQRATCYNCECVFVCVNSNRQNPFITVCRSEIQQEANCP